MKTEIISKIHDHIIRENVLMGAALAEELNTAAPEGFRPRDLLPNAKTVLVFAQPLPLAVYLVPGENNNFYQRSSYTHYLIMDKLANDLSLMIQQAGYQSLPIPSYSPLRFYKGEPRGIISLKHAAVYAGLGKMGQNTLLINPKHGNVMRLGALMTEMEWPEYPAINEKNFCPDDCRLCEQACPVGALKNGNIDKTKCMGNCIKHILLPPKFMLPLMKRTVAASKLMTRFMELTSLNFFETYAIDCAACLKACIHFPGNKIKKIKADNAAR
jgi:epoxyqueuosine reductase